MKMVMILDEGLKKSRISGFTNERKVSTILTTINKFKGRSKTDMNPWLVKSINLWDYPAIQKLHNSAFPASQHSHKKMIRRFLRSSLMLKLCDGKRPASYIAIDLDSNRGQAWINIIATHPEYQGQGLAKELLRICEAAIFLPEMWLLVEDGNESAIRLYEKCGYEIINRKVKYYPTGRDGIEMRKILRSAN